MAKRAPQTLRLRLPLHGVEAFVRAWAMKVEHGCLLLPTRRVWGPGTKVRFELQSLEGERLLLGEGEVSAHRPRATATGLLLKVTRMDSVSRERWKAIRALARVEVQTLPGAPGPEGLSPDESPDDEPTAVADPGEAGGRVDEASTPPRRSREVLMIDGGDEETTAAGRPSRLPPQDLVAADAPTTPEGSRGPGRGLGRADAHTDSVARVPASAPGDTRRATLVGAFAGDASDDVSPILGIDLGTCRVLAAVADERGARCLPLDKAGRGLPAVLASGRGGQILIGASALARRLEQPGETVFGSKRLLGQRFFSPAVQRLAEVFPYELVPDAQGGVAVSLAAHTLGITEINARILGAVKAGAELALGQAVHRAVISVPAFFGDAGRAAVRQAGLEAGLEVLRIVSEPTAAALAHGYGKKMPGKRVLVFDLGGGTFDVSVLTISGDRFEVVATGGDNFLGGLDFDLEIVRALLKVVLKGGGPERADPAMLERLLAEAEKAKIALSSAKRFALKMDALWEGGDGISHDLLLDLARDELERWVEPLVERTIALTQTTLRDHGLSADQLDEVVLVGAQTRMPLLRRRLAESLGLTVEAGVDPEQAVALGCALVARNIQDASNPRAAKVDLQDILGLNIGIGLPDGRIAPVIERGTEIPCKRTVRIATQEAEQASLEVAIFQGNVRAIEHAAYLGTMCFLDLPQAPAGEVQLVLVFELDDEGLLTVRAVEEASGREVSRVLSTVETPEEVQEKLGRSRTVIRDLSNLMHSDPKPGRESSRIMRGIRNLFGGGA